MLTEYGKKVLKVMKENGLLLFYDDLYGNCCFTKEEFDEYLPSIKKVVETLSDYGVLRQSIEEYGYDYKASSDGYLYFLTDFGFEDMDEDDDSIIILPKEVVR